MLKNWFAKRKAKEQREYRLERRAIIFDDAVRWLGCHFPVLMEVEKLIQQDAVMTMTRRMDICKKVGYGGLTLAQLIYLTDQIWVHLEAKGDWSSCQLHGDLVTPIAYGSEISKLFVGDVYRSVHSIPKVVIHVGLEKDIPIVREAVKKFESDFIVHQGFVIPEIEVRWTASSEDYKMPMPMSMVDPTPIRHVRKIRL